MKRRVIIDNDFAGDPDDLFQLVHHMLSPSVEICGIIGSHLAPGDLLDGSDRTAEHAAAAARETLRIMGMGDECAVYQGSNHAIRDARKAVHSDGSRFIVEEAMRPVDTELYIACGGGLTDVALALMLNPEIENRIKILWIGGPEHRRSKQDKTIEYNLNIDLAAARYVFNETRAELWQVPRDVYRQCLVSMAELRARVLPCGDIGRHLYRSVESALEKFGKVIPTGAETYVLGDQPLVLLSALQSFFNPDASSCEYRIANHVRISMRGRYSFGVARRPIKVFGTVDTRLMFEDFYRKLGEFGA
jgi:inosine-uridine nucleoside N-ribohydrolase